MSMEEKQGGERREYKESGKEEAGRKKKRVEVKELKEGKQRTR